MINIAPSTFIAKINIQREAFILWFEWIVLVCTFVIYMYFIATSVAQVVLRQELLVSIQEEETKISRLEAVYFERMNTISKELASTYGLVALSDPQYVHISAVSSNRLTRND